jgi:hypothetical protein
MNTADIAQLPLYEIGVLFTMESGEQYRMDEIRQRMREVYKLDFLEHRTQRACGELVSVGLIDRHTEEYQQLFTISARGRIALQRIKAIMQEHSERFVRLA